MADTPKHSVSVAGIVVDDQDRVLVIQRRDNGHWEPPGGVLELDETPEEGVIREVAEETGLDVLPIRLSGIYKNMSIGVIALVFRCRVVAGREVTTDESRRVMWFTEDQVIASMYPAYSIRVSDALGEKLTPSVRSHDGKQLVDSFGRCSELRP